MWKLLFTDIDGVFNSKSSRRATRRDGILHDVVQRFDTFIVAHHVCVVLTTAQRRYTSFDELLDILGTTQRHRFLGVTPVASGVNKSVDIEQWFAARPHMQGTPYGILDDHPLMYSLVDMERRLVTVDGHVGLQDAQLVKLLPILNATDTTDTIAL